MNLRPKALSSVMLKAAILCLSLLLSVASNAQRLRLVGGNISSGNGQNYDPGHGARIFKGLNPDVVMIQEFNYLSNSTTDIRKFVTDNFGAGFSYFRETGAQIPNGIISRYPILSSGEWTDPKVNNRDFAWARIDIPGPRHLWAISVHFLTSSSGNRNDEANALIDYIEANVPATDYIVIGGDFNSDGRTESQFTTLGAYVNTVAPHPADRNGNQNTNANRNKPYDSVFASYDLKALQVPVVIGSSTFTNGLVADTRVYTPISEISPALSSDSGATGMQHMAIVKDFMLPTDPLSITATSPLAPGTVGSALSRTFTATGGTTPYTWSIASGNLPAGLTLTTGGVLSGTPTAAATFTFTARVTDSASATATKSFTMAITPQLAISSSSPLALGTVGTPYSQTVTASGGTAPYTWSVASGTPPAGLAFGTGGILAGTPAAAGTFNFTARVTDSAGASTTKFFSLTVKEPLTIFLESYSLPGNSAALDSDGDGIINLLEYVLGGNPTSADRVILPPVVFSADGSQISYSFPSPTTPGSTSWMIQYSTDLTIWKTVLDIEGGSLSSYPLNETRSTFTGSVPVSSGGKGFFRLLVTGP